MAERAGPFPQAPESGSVPAERTHCLLAIASRSRCLGPSLSPVPHRGRGFRVVLSIVPGARQQQEIHFGSMAEAVYLQWALRPLTAASGPVDSDLQSYLGWPLCSVDLH